ncbi:MAG: hypothetical protein Q8S29_08905, partial [Phreatobacter sp.]|nr:hypothetical protein [Phreatobacter sp.]
LRAAGSEASASHKAMSSIVSTLSDASNQGSDFDKALRSMGLRTRTFAQSFRRDANGTILDFLTKLNALAPDKRDSAISNIFGNDQAEEIRRLAQQVDRIRTLQGQLNDRPRTRGAVQREFDIFSDADFAKLERAQQAIDTLTSRLGRLGKLAGGAVADVINRAVDALEPSRQGAAEDRERSAANKLADLERQLAEARAPGGLTGRAAGLQASVDAARKEYEEAARAVGRPSGFRSERSATAAGREPSVVEQRAVEPGLRRAPTPGARPDDARRQDAAAMRAELERTLEAARAIEDKLPALRQATIGAAFNDPSRAALSSALSELDKLQAKAAEIDGQMKTLFGPEFSSQAGAAAQQAAGQINTALDGAATTAHA